MVALRLPDCCVDDGVCPAQALQVGERRPGLNAPFVQALAGGPGALADVWQADQVSPQYTQVRSSGYMALDAQLPGGGWPVGVLIELLQGQAGLSEWRLLLPVLAADPQAAPVVIVGPPHVPFGPSLAVQGLAPERLVWVHSSTPAQCLWASEQALRCATVGAVVAWLPKARAEQLRRLHWAAHTYQKLLFVFRPTLAKDQSSPASLRLQILSASFTGTAPASEAVHLKVLKRRGPMLLSTLALPLQNTRLVQVIGGARKGLGLIDDKPPEAVMQNSPHPASGAEISDVMARAMPAVAAGAVT